MLAAVGLFGLLSFDVSRRTHEIGTRMALSAEAASVLRLAVGRGIVLAIVGAAIGAAVALGMTRLIAGVLVPRHNSKRLRSCMPLSLFPKIVQIRKLDIVWSLPIDRKSEQITPCRLVYDYRVFYAARSYR